MFQCVKHKKNCKNVSNTHKEGINRGVRYRIRYFIDVYKKRLQGSVNVLQWIGSCLSVNLFLLVSGFVPACQWICSCLSVNLFLPVSEFVPACQWICSCLSGYSLSRIFCLFMCAAYTICSTQHFPKRTS